MKCDRNNLNLLKVNQNVNLQTTQVRRVEANKLELITVNRSVMQPRYSDNFNAHCKRHCSIWPTGAT